MRGISQHDLSATNNINWLPGGFSGGMCLARLISKVAPARPMPAAHQPAQQLLYSVAWQAHSSAGVAAARLASRPAAPAVAWSLQPSGASSAGTVAVQAGRESDAGFAAAHLQFLQQAVQGGGSPSSLHLHTPAAALAQPAGAGSSAPLRQLQQAALLQGLVKVAAQDAENVNWVQSSCAPQQPAGERLPAQQLPNNDVFGPSQAGGTILAPRLLPAAVNRPPSGEQAAAGACLVTGGLGALGTLIASQQLAAAGSGSAGSTHVVLLGRSISFAQLEAALGSVWSRVAAAGSAAQLTVASCDAGAAADVAGLARRLSAGGVRVGSILHSAGVLRVSEAGREAVYSMHNCRWRACRVRPQAQPFLPGPHRVPVASAALAKARPPSRPCRTPCFPIKQHPTCAPAWRPNRSQRAGCSSAWPPHPRQAGWCCLVASPACWAAAGRRRMPLPTRRWMQRQAPGRGRCV